MKPVEHLGTAQIPGQVPGPASELRLYRHDRAYMFSVDRTELMTSRAHGSEEELAELAFARLGDRAGARVLVGGLGMGYTLASVLGLVDADAEVDVVELIPEVVVWNREWLGELNGHPLRDGRVSVIEGDVVEHIRGARARYDVILLDVDNGPKAVTSDTNDWLYGQAGLAATGTALRPRGVLAIWSADHHPWFTKRMRSVGFDVSAERVRARRDKGEPRTIWVANLR